MHKHADAHRLSLLYFLKPGTQYIDLLIKMLFLKIGENCRADASDADAGVSVHCQELRSLRAEIYSGAEGAAQARSVSELAARLHLSPAHFQKLYKKQFGVSCFEDMLNARIAAAKYYLINTSLTVGEISALCGYENEVHFMRQFKKRTGCTPTQFRNT